MQTRIYEPMLIEVEGSLERIALNIGDKSETRDAANRNYQNLRNQLIELMKSNSPIDQINLENPSQSSLEEFIGFIKRLNTVKVLNLFFSDTDGYEESLNAFFKNIKDLKNVAVVTIHMNDKQFNVSNVLYTNLLKRPKLTFALIPKGDFDEDLFKQDPIIKELINLKSEKYFLTSKNPTSTVKIMAQIKEEKHTNIDHAQNNKIALESLAATAKQEKPIENNIQIESPKGPKNTVVELHQFMHYLNPTQNLYQEFPQTNQNNNPPKMN